MTQEFQSLASNYLMIENREYFSPKQGITGNSPFSDTTKPLQRGRQRELIVNQYSLGITLLPKDSVISFAWFPGEQVSATHAVLPSRVFFACATKAVEAGRYAYILKSQVAQERD